MPDETVETGDFRFQQPGFVRDFENGFLSGDVPASLYYAGVMSSFSYASEGDVFLFSSAALQKQKGDV